MPKGTTQSTQLTEFIWIKKPFTPEQKIELGQKMADADERLSGKEAELDAAADAFKETKKQLEGEMVAIQSELHDRAREFRRGYEEVKTECTVKYEGNRKLSYDKDSGELVEDREMTEAEQLRLSGKMIDAEVVIQHADDEDNDGDGDE